MRHVLYRFYDSGDQLLFVGITANFAKRSREHRRDKALGMWVEMSKSVGGIAVTGDIWRSAWSPTLNTVRPAWS